MAACDWHTYQDEAGQWYWMCDMGCAGGPYTRQQKAVVAALEHGDCASGS